MTEGTPQNTHATTLHTSPRKEAPLVHLTDCRPVRWGMVPTTKNALAAVGHLVSVMLMAEAPERRRGPEALAGLAQAMGALALDLFAAHESSVRFLSCTLGEDDKGPETAHAPVSSDDVTAAASFMLASGFAEGCPDRLCGSALLVGLLTTVFDVGAVEAERDDVAAVLELRTRSAKAHGGKQTAGVKVTEETRRMAERVMSGNRLRASVTIIAPGYRPRPGDSDLRRIFTNRDCQHGGRFAGGWWMSLPAKKRRRITIDGEAVIELDYRTFQPRICFDLSGHLLPLKEDIYAVPGYDEGRYREAIKATVARLLSISDNQPLTRLGAVKKLFPSDAAFAEFVAAVEEKLAPLMGWVRCGRGTELDWIGSEIADEVLARLTALLIPCLPVHDSFIVPVSAERVSGRIMVEAYWHVLRRWTTAPSIPAISGWSSPESENEWTAWVAACVSAA